MLEDRDLVIGKAKLCDGYFARNRGRGRHGRLVKFDWQAESSLRCSSPKKKTFALALLGSQDSHWEPSRRLTRLRGESDADTCWPQGSSMLVQGGARVAGSGLGTADLLRPVCLWRSKTQPTRTRTKAAAAALNLRSSRQSDRLLVAGCREVVGGAHSRCSCGATDIEAGGGDSSDVDTAELRGTRTDTEHGGAESSWSHGGTTTWTVTASTEELAATASARTASLFRLRGGHGQTVGFGRDRSRERGVGSGGWRIKSNATSAKVDFLADPRASVSQG